MISWSPGAIAAMQAARARLDPNGRVSTINALLAWLDMPEPGQSALHAALRDGALWPNQAQARQASLTGFANANWNPGSLREPGFWEVQAEEQARKEEVLRVGERHLVAAMSDSEFQALSISPSVLRSRVRDFELGTLTLTQEQSQRIHLVPDTSALVEYVLPLHVIWSDALNEPGAEVQLWLVGSVLNELDELKRHVNVKLADRARERGRWLWSLFPEAASTTGCQLRADCWIRVWQSRSASPFRDTDHLEAALELRSLGVPVQVLTDDTLMLARASTVGMRVRRLDDKWRLAKATAAGQQP